MAKLRACSRSAEVHDRQPPSSAFASPRQPVPPSSSSRRALGAAGRIASYARQRRHSCGGAAKSAVHGSSVTGRRAARCRASPRGAAAIQSPSAFPLLLRGLAQLGEDVYREPGRMRSAQGKYQHVRESSPAEAAGDHTQPPAPFPPISREASGRSMAIWLTSGLPICLHLPLNRQSREPMRAKASTSMSRRSPTGSRPGAATLMPARAVDSAPTVSRPSASMPTRRP